MSLLISNKLNWKIAADIEEVAIQKLTNQVRNLHPVIAEILLKRGIDSYELIEKFFKNDLNAIHDFGVLKDCDKAANRIVSAINKGEKILIYGDYDVDGTTGVSMLLMFLKSMGAQVSYYIPDRYTEGYGVSQEGVDYALNQKVDVMITIDCGIRAVQELEKLSNSAVDVIICDHHLPGNSLPEVYAILNPLQPGCGFQGKELCGCGVGLMLLISLSQKLNRPDEWKEYLDLAAIATCCDIVPLTGINRLIVHAGIHQLNTNRRQSIAALLTVARYNEAVDVSDVVFKIGPRINAAGRLDHARMAVNLFTETEYEKAIEIAKEIDALNTERKNLDKSITESAFDQLRKADPKFNRRSTVVHSKEWHKGVIGIVASRLIERCYRPTIVLTNIDGMLTGSGRSVNGVNLYDALHACSHHLDKFGGHAAAAGLSLRAEALDDFIHEFEKEISARAPENGFSAELHIDVEVPFDTWNNNLFDRFYAQLNRCRPFGPENLQPVFATHHCLAKNVKVVGENHLKFDVYQNYNPGLVIPVIAFGMGNYFANLINNKEFSLAYTIEMNEWMGNKSKQLSAKAIELA